MAADGGVWGIDIGQCGLKALRCVMGKDGQSVVATAFDFIEYPKILSQPDAEPDKLVREALKQFLSRNSVRDSKVAISVSGQSGLARFIKLPPVESKKIPDIVKYEARQQIPFAIEDVIWDYQQMPGGSEEDGFTLETEVGLFAMKRDQVFRFIQPLVDAEVELDIIQLTPLCIFNAVVHDVLSNGSAAQEYDPENPPPSVVVLSMGTDTSDLVVTNGYRVWQRSIPLGGNHFTKQLTKEMKLTFAKAEHLKRNTRDAEDPKAIFQAMRSVFSDLVTEVQRSIGYFRNLDKTSRIDRIVMLGNTVKLPGLQRYLAKNLDQDVVKLDSFNRLTGSSVVSAPAFKDNLLSFAVCYGLCLQGLGQGKLSTNLVPREIIVQRMIRRKKPWAAAVVGILMLAFTFHFFFKWSAWYSVNDSRDVAGTTWLAAKKSAEGLKGLSSGYESADEEQMLELARLDELGEAAVVTTEGRLLWLELLKAINEALPRDPSLLEGKVPSLQERPLENRPELYVLHIESEFFPDLSTWFNAEVRKKYIQGQELSRDPKAAEAATGDEAAAGADGAASDAENDVVAEASEEDTELVGPEGPGWVIEIGAVHFHNGDPANWGQQYVRNTLLKKLDGRDGGVTLPVRNPDGKTTNETFTFEELGIRFPILAHDKGNPRTWKIPNPNYQPKTGTELSGVFGVPRQPTDQKQATEDTEPEFINPMAYVFSVQFCWQQTPASERLRKRQQKLEEQLESANSVAAAQR